MNHFLPQGYRVRLDHELYIDVPSQLTYQPHVYALAAFLADRSGVKWIVDIGCGSGGKLKALIPHFDIVGIDCAAGISLARKNLPQAQLIEFDMENGLPDIPADILNNAVVICSDVIEHLQRPKQLMKSMAQVSKLAPFVLISTPDRDRARGWLDSGPPANPAHVMEWAPSEFVRFMRGCGFSDIPFYGHTVNTDFHRVKSTLLIVAGTHATYDVRDTNFRVAAIIHTYNEADILHEAVDHLISQGVEVHIFDNWSNDGTWKIISELHSAGVLSHAERFPEAPSSDYLWHMQLAKTAEYAATLDAQWVMHHDADEIRSSPWEGGTLRDAFAKIDHLGYNSVDFTVIDFRFLADLPDPKPPYQQTTTHFEFGRRPGHFSQVKAWKNKNEVQLAASGGHEAVFEGRRVYPIKFLLRHYPLRNRIQAKNKVFRDRLPRLRAEQQLYGWHTQYDHFQNEAGINGWDANTLIPWHSKYFMSEFVVERISGIGLS